MIRLHDTLTRTVEPLATREPGKVSMYVCGPTVYGPPHLGHGRFALVFDVLRRYLLWSGLEVTYVSNITDIDDKIIQRAAEEHRDPAEVAVEWEGVWWEVMDALGVLRPDADPHATAYVEAMVALIDQLVGSGDAYVTGDGVYLSVERVPGLRRCSPTRASTTSWPAAASARSWASRRSATRPTSRCGSRPSRASRPGPRPGATGVRGGTPSAW